MAIPTLDDDHHVVSSSINNPRLCGGEQAAVVAPPTTAGDRTFEEGVVVDIPSLHEEEQSSPITKTKEPSITLLYGTPTYDNLLDKNREPPAVKPLQASLHTTCSDVSIELGALLLAQIQTDKKKARAESSVTTRYESIHEVEDNVEDVPVATENKDHDGVVWNTSLSLHVSEMDVSQLDDMDSEFTVATPSDSLFDDLQEGEPNRNSATLMEEEDGPPTTVEKIQDVRSEHTSIAVEKSDPEEVSKDNTTCKAEKTHLSFLFRHHKGGSWLLFFFLMTSVARGICNWLLSSSRSIIVDYSQQDEIMDDQSHILSPDATGGVDISGPKKAVLEKLVLLGGRSFFTQEIQWTTSLWLYDVCQFLIFAAIAKLLLQKSFGTSSSSTTSKKTSRMKKKETTNDDEFDDACSVPSLIPIKLEEDDTFVSDYNLSNYDAMKVSELRDLLRAKKCNYTGKKAKLIHRLATVYRSELQSLTVVQLRRKTKAKGIMQQQGRGLKKELVQQLVEQADFGKQ
jgi:hypothetical protein